MAEAAQVPDTLEVPELPRTASEVRERARHRWKKAINITVEKVQEEKKIWEVVGAMGATGQRLVKEAIAKRASPFSEKELDRLKREFDSVAAQSPDRTTLDRGLLEKLLMRRSYKSRRDQHRKLKLGPSPGKSLYGDAFHYPAKLYQDDRRIAQTAVIAGFELIGTEFMDFASFLKFQENVVSSAMFSTKKLQINTTTSLNIANPSTPRGGLPSLKDSARAVKDFMMGSPRTRCEEDPSVDSLGRPRFPTWSPKKRQSNWSVPSPTGPETPGSEGDSARRRLSRSISLPRLSLDAAGGWFSSPSRTATQESHRERSHPCERAQSCERSRSSGFFSNPAAFISPRNRRSPDAKTSSMSNMSPRSPSRQELKISPTGGRSWRFGGGVKGLFSSFGSSFGRQAPSAESECSEAGTLEKTEEESSTRLAS
jgi:hypothetical protein